MFKPMKRLFLVLIGSILAFGSAQYVYATSFVNTPFNNNTSDAGVIWNTGLLALILCGLLGLFVIVLLIVVGWKYREGSKTIRKPLSHSAEKKLEYTWMVLSLALVVIAASVTIAAMGAIDNSQNTQNVSQIYYIQGSQFRWTFFSINNTNIQQPITNMSELQPYMTLVNNSNGVNGLQDLNLTVNHKYEFIISSIDVIHSFFVYDLNIKQDAVPGRFASIFITPTQIGSFSIRCAQFCGVFHYTMSDVQFVNVNA